MLPFIGEGTVFNYGMTVAKEFDVQEKFKHEFLRFWNQYGLLTVSKVVLYQKPVHNMMRATIMAGQIFTLLMFPHATN